MVKASIQIPDFVFGFCQIVQKQTISLCAISGQVWFQTLTVFGYIILHGTWRLPAMLPILLLTKSYNSLWTQMKSSLSFGWWELSDGRSIGSTKLDRLKEINIFHKNWKAFCQPAFCQCYVNSLNWVEMFVKIPKAPFPNNLVLYSERPITERKSVRFSNSSDFGCSSSN